MDAHDAILEQLKRAQKRGFEAVTNRLDFVLESLEELIQEAKASVQEALPQEAEELFPVEDVVAAVGDCRTRTTQADKRIGALSTQITELGQRLQEAEGRPAEAVSLELLRRLDEARSQSDILRELLPKLSEHAARSVVLVIRGGAISAWSGIGFDDGDALRRWQADLASSDLFQRFASEGHPLHFTPADDPVLTDWLDDAEEVLEGLLLPVCLRGKVVGAVYIDRLEDRPWNPETAQVLVALTCWLIDTLSYRQTVPSPLLTPPAEISGEGETPVGESEVPSEPTPDAGYPPVEPPPEADDVDDEPTGEIPPVEEDGLADEPADMSDERALDDDEMDGYDPSATVRIETPVVPDVVAETEAAEAEWEVEDEPEEPELDEPVPDAELAPPEPEEPPTAPEDEVPVDEPPPEVQPVMPPAEVQPVTPPDDFKEPTAEPSPEDDARHEEARRFARLLVSEIKLYNEEEVERGRANNDLYQRLRDDIDRSREMFEKRIPPEVRESRDYFREELIRVLADGDADALGM